MPSDINNNGKNSNTSLSDTHTLTNKESDGALSTSIVTKPDSPHPCPPPPPPSPVEYVAECSLSETKPKDATVLSSSTGAAGPATAKSKVDLSGMSRYEKQRFWGWLCDEDGRVDVTHPAFTGFQPH